MTWTHQQVQREGSTWRAEGPCSLRGAQMNFFALASWPRFVARLGLASRHRQHRRHEHRPAIGLSAGTLAGFPGSRGPREIRCYAKPRKKLPSRSVDVFCKICNTRLYRYAKGGKGSLVKCFVERITEDFTEEKCVCPGCGKTFARETIIRGAPAFKLIGGKVYQK